MKAKTMSFILMMVFATGSFLVFAGYGIIAAQMENGDCFNHGDVNFDGAITAADAQLAFFIVLGAYSPTFEQECAADCNGDGEVTAADAQAIFQVVLGQGECADPLLPGEYEPGDLCSVDNIIGNMRYVAEGTFTQGSPETEDCRFNREGPQFLHTFSRNLAVMETEVTRGMWEDLKTDQPALPNDPSDLTKSPSMYHPVQRITWYEAVLYANLLSIQNGLTPCYYLDETFETVIDETNHVTNDVYCDFDANGYRLPTEGEWEYFTRAGTTGEYWIDEPSYEWGSCETCTPSPPLNMLDSIAWWCGNSEQTSHPVGAKLANPWGLYDVHGNVREWCWDRWSSSYPTDTVTDYAGPTTGDNRVDRGGAWSDWARICRSAYRLHHMPGTRNNARGFRLVRTIP